MRCEVLLFARLAEDVGAERLELDLPEGASVDEALEQLGREHEPIARLRDVVARPSPHTFLAETSLI